MTTPDAARGTRTPETFSPKVAIALFLVGVFSFAAFITLSTFAPDFADGDDAGAHALSRSAIGYAAAVKLARARGAVVTVTRTSSAAATGPLVVLTPPSKLMATDIEKLADWRALVVLPKYLPIPDFTHTGWVGATFSMSEDAVAEILADIAPGAKVARAKGTASPILTYDGVEAEKINADAALRPGAITELQTVTAKDLIPVLKTADGRIVLGVIRFQDKPDTYVLTEPDLLNTQGLAEIDTARAGMAILDALRAPSDPIAFDVTLHGFERTRSLLRLAFEPPLLAATLSLLMAAALLAWRAATRAGPAAAPARAIALGKRTLADNSAALFRLARREHTMARRYAAFTATTVAEKLGVWRGENEETIAELDRIGATRGVTEKFSDLAAEASAAQSGADATTAARKLHSWNEEILRATR
ncbi:MAG: DUF4350 domain-containing protein [Alphaproteobacteria bacterium]|nr:DUF4350 domain-containing protein [Alphaproteobacteria bacterium]